MEMGVVEENQGHYVASLQDLKESLGYFQDAHDRFEEAEDRREIGIVESDLGDYEGGMASLEQALKIFEQLGDRAEISTTQRTIVTVRNAHNRTPTP